MALKHKKDNCLAQGGKQIERIRKEESFYSPLKDAIESQQMSPVETSW